MTPDNKCPFCGGNVDPKGWLCGDGRRGPECMGCGATAPDMTTWNTRPLESQARAEALEEAAKVCEEHCSPAMARDAADEIRALKEQQ